MRRLSVLALVSWLGCAGPAAVPPPAPAPPAAPRAPAEPPPPPAACAGELAPHREVLVRGRATEIAWGGVRATYLGRTHDHFTDGTHALMLSFEIAGQPWLPDSRDTRYAALGDHCIRLVSSTADRAELDVALQPAHAYDPRRCHAGCCRDHTPGPDGTIECCFCSDAP